MSESIAYAAHAELCAMTLPHEDVTMLKELHDEAPDFATYPISGDALAVVKVGTPLTRSQRCNEAADLRIAR